MECSASTGEDARVKSTHELSLSQWRCQSHSAEEETEAHKYFVVCRCYKGTHGIRWQTFTSAACLPTPTLKLQSRSCPPVLEQSSDSVMVLRIHHGRGDGSLHRHHTHSVKLIRG